jgi:phosphatidylinositol-3-phosphatase
MMIKAAASRRVLTLLAAAVSLMASVAIPASSASAASAPPRFAHVLIVIMENKDYRQIIGRPDEAPYLNKLASTGANFTKSFAIGHPSEPNYLALFSGSAHGLSSDKCPVNFGQAPNLGAELIAAKLSFTAYSESLPSAGFTGNCTEVSLGYTRVHSPWTDFSNVPGADSQPFTKFPSSFAKLPVVSFVVPNLCHDMHYCSRDSGDHWIQAHLSGYANWARAHDSLLIITWDEDDSAFGASGDNNQIPTIFYGAHVHAGAYSEKISHYNVLRTIEDMYGLPHLGTSAKAAPITDIWN